MTSDPTPPRGRRAFTLLEVLVVLAITAIAAALLVPRLDPVGGLAVETAARRLADAAALARDRAILGGHSARLVVDLDGARWVADGSARALAPHVRFRGVTIAGETVAQSGVVTLSFEPVGSPAARIDLDDDRGHTASVVLPPAPGRPRVDGGGAPAGRVRRCSSWSGRSASRRSS